jgi:hypothetical protein
LLGTNSTRLVSGVTEYYPQEKGAVIVKRRTSRSGHELLLAEADGAGNARLLHSAFDFGDAALNGTRSKWAGFVRPSLGTEWDVVVAPISHADARARTLPLPEGVRSGRIAWSGEDLMILVDKGQGKVCYEISPAAATPKWRTAAAYTFPGIKSFMLNKSETLEINQINVNGRPGVEVVRVWFTGDRNVVARIPGITLRGYDLVGPGYAFVWGERNSGPVACTVGISTKEVIHSFHGPGQNIKPFEYPPHSNPLPLK